MEDGRPAAEGPIAVTDRSTYQAFESPDGRDVYFCVRDTAGLFRVPVAGGSIEAIPELSAVAPGRNWIVTPQGIVFMRPAADNLFAIERFDPVARRIDRLYTGPWAWTNFPGLAVSPDGRTIVLPRTEQQRVDIMMVERFK